MSHKIQLLDADFGSYVIAEVRKNGKELFLQTDYDYVQAAETFGHSKRDSFCHHGGTDGTVTCPDCGRTADYFIGKARTYLDNHIGKIIMDRSGIF